VPTQDNCVLGIAGPASLARRQAGTRAACHKLDWRQARFSPGSIAATTVLLTSVAEIVLLPAIEPLTVDPPRNHSDRPKWSIMFGDGRAMWR